MNDEVKKRLTWIKLYEDTQNAGLACRRCSGSIIPDLQIEVAMKIKIEKVISQGDVKSVMGFSKDKKFVYSLF